MGLSKSVEFIFLIFMIISNFVQIRIFLKKSGVLSRRLSGCFYDYLWSCRELSLENGNVRKK